MKRIFIISGMVLAIAACTQTFETMSRADAIAMCNAQAVEAAQVLSGNTTLGVNSQTGGFFGAGVQINLTPKPQAQTFEACMNELAANGQILEG